MANIQNYPPVPAFHLALPLASNRPISMLPPNVLLCRKEHRSHILRSKRAILVFSRDVTKRREVTCSSRVGSKWDALSAAQFDHLMESGSLAICFVGMSNCGKSYWSRQLHERLKFDLLSVDKHIEGKLHRILQADGHVGIDGLAAWMGFPSDARFAKNQATYLLAEEDITGKATPSIGRNSVLDTTGSVVYLAEDTRNRLVQDYLVVHLEASDDLLEVMTDNYFKTPKPVVWGDCFNWLTDETANEALRRCYPSLLRDRRDRYGSMAHITLPASISLRRGLEIKEFINELRSRLPIIV